MTQALLPAPIANADSTPYWDAARADKLVLPHCRSCGHTFFMPRHQCPQCWSADLEWKQASGRGTVHSFSVVRRASLATFAARTPYVLALIDLEDGPRMMTNIVGEGALDTRIGDAVTVCFEACADGAKLPQFQRKA
ncbi:Zn-ribbon domain-containing OB-fold protein [Imbroritus primus]|uniref:Zn-ribbon domain-containing OB-fold protein n=1 Tax=Imbroritus primus TaxID=3058603 RepID=A0ACD3SPX0_9BURK|nr:Zn-ribbon domain-containing OB-fold protein [Burkholderiaceae bacterium PBA]